MTDVHQPLYARLLRLRHVAPSGFLCFVYLEGAVALGILLALAELVSWWGVLALPATVAVMVKLNDVIAGSLIQSAPVAVHASPAARSSVAGSPAAGSSIGAERARMGETPPSLRPASAYGPVEHAPAARLGEDATRRLPGLIDRDRGAPIKRPWVEKAEAQQQWIRQSATRRYE
ncbi:hypothetical protein [Paractinoplanes atraurantiacus]|uniref:Uncharacterized protein n=1 Tax=Paractinoplanes atraurantiacus TaxID=1036182 RepID=A0A285HKW0_9ACTN|nr:hypothetical protein [Actinoplanes atraurantiacus]SNY35416.1 hypothetical protein SAMN05421748_104428 [Actinoplanes atraurantiacus]